ncbi:two-component sensor histidine kinase [Pseudoxanthomonas jiangsuensis]|uniref:sensor histidine kinase n=1 Tax=Pseudoxanthomonas jiangsuensis TaxID=619688 RepID=UPI001391D6A4|nr:sensor histidine kinase [Pseudoxanthomonas jiangsuensis]KAF1692714.1 two-component sensor histidine kinase [Pseudoxanthomonas jiangsuensis]
MLGRLSHTNLLRYAGIYTWALVGLPIILNIWFLPPSRGLDGDGISVPMTALAYFSFGACYWLATASLGRGGRRAAAWNVLLLLAMNAAAIGVGFYTQTGLGAVLLMIMAGVLPWLAGIRIAVLWLVVAHIALVPSFMARDDFNFWESLLQSLFYVGFSAFVLTTAYVARQQAQARDEQRRLNAELRATRALLAESARVNERTRISRELHDLLGHHLTALSLNLEVASHMTEGRAQEHVRQAHTLAKLLLTDVREAVSQLRDASGGIDLATALRPLADHVPALDIDLQIESPLAVDDPERAHVVLRCTQEIITNAVRHAGARRLAIRVWREDGAIRLEARDDGQGADGLVPGNGLRGMRERLQHCGGTLDIQTRRGAGFQLRLSVPLSAPARTAIEGALP